MAFVTRAVGVKSIGPKFEPERVRKAKPVVGALRPLPFTMEIDITGASNVNSVLRMVPAWPVTVTLLSIDRSSPW
jgi:hypothetical protein